MKARDIGALALKNVLRARWKTVLCALAVCVGAASRYIVWFIRYEAVIMCLLGVLSCGMVLPSLDFF